MSAAVRVVQTSLNGLPGFVFHTSGRHVETLALEVVDGHSISALYSIRNPDKVAHLA